MSGNGQEIEAKFYVLHLDKITTRLDELKARLIHPRGLEANIRFDLPDASLLSEGRVLRLRHDTEARLTYKSASDYDRGILSRKEIEFTVEDFDKAKRFLEALGYQKLFYYEKYRSTYEFENTHIMLDELPYGNFVEIEGDHVESIQAVAAILRLDWNTTIAASYSALFKRTHRKLNFSFQDLSFENFAGIQINASHLGVRAADN